MMNRKEFERMLDSFGPIGVEEWQGLCRWRDSAPYSAPLQLLSLQADRDNDAPLWRQVSQPRAALYLAAGVIARTLRITPQTPNREATVPPMRHQEVIPHSPATHQEDEDSGTFDVLRAINSYHEESFKTAPKSVILSHFLENDGGMFPHDIPFDVTPVQELAKRSVRRDDSVCSETLALVLERQGKIEQAIEMYKKLLFANPEKSSTFANRIAALSTQLSDKE